MMSIQFSRGKLKGGAQSGHSRVPKAPLRGRLGGDQFPADALSGRRADSQVVAGERRATTSELASP